MLIIIKRLEFCLSPFVLCPQAFSNVSPVIHPGLGHRKGSESVC